METTWLKRMNSVLDYIEHNLDGEIDDNKIAMLSASYKGMFQRVFAIITDMTLSEYIRKRRLTQAAVDIQNTNAKIIDIAVKYGYNSANAFSSAFKNFHGITPSYARESGLGVQAFHRFTFTLTLSVKGGNDMNYRNIENAEKIMQKMVGKEQITSKYLQNVSEHNGVKCVCDGNRVAVILPEGVPDWDLRDAYFDTGDKDNPKALELNKVFNDNGRNNSVYNFQMSKKQAENFNTLLDLSNLNNEAVCVNVKNMEIVTHEIMSKLKNKPGEHFIAFNIKYLKEAFNFILCSEDDEYIEVYYISDHEAFIMKSSRLYAAVLPVRIRTE